MSPESGLVGFMRRALLALLILGLAGTEAELFLLRHTEGFWQILPVVLVGLALLLAIWCAARPGPGSLSTLRLLMVVFLIAGVVGVVQHFTGNVGYEKESNPGLGGIELYKAAVMGATPLLAPGIMLQLGIIGLLYGFHHPASKRTDE
ncbi:MAG TPA: hypothetical protein VFO55_00070 [Gemmatimonadaceae bacterium]|nr:hypothetical protein [Gemmatimonadaceae bacterium]